MALTLLGTLLLLALVAWPSFYRRDLLRSLDTHQRLARAQAQGDTYEGYLQASVQLKDGLASQGAAPAPIGALTEGYLEGLRLGGLAQRRRELGAELALTHAVLEQRFGARPDPGSQVLADPLPPSPQERAARAEGHARQKGAAGQAAAARGGGVCGLVHGCLLGVCRKVGCRKLGCKKEWVDRRDVQKGGVQAVVCDR